MACHDPGTPCLLAVGAVLLCSGKVDSSTAPAARLAVERKDIHGESFREPCNGVLACLIGVVLAGTFDSLHVISAQGRLALVEEMGDEQILIIQTRVATGNELITPMEVALEPFLSPVVTAALWKDVNLVLVEEALVHFSAGLGLGVGQDTLVDFIGRGAGADGSLQLSSSDEIILVVDVGALEHEFQLRLTGEHAPDEGPQLRL